MDDAEAQKLKSTEGLDVTITIGADGRMYFHDLTPDMVPIAAAICPDDSELIARQTMIEDSQRENA